MRNGSSLNCYRDSLVLFGGIHDITWELDDLWIYETKGNKWRMVYEDTTRRREQDTQSLSPMKESVSNNKKKVSLNTPTPKQQSSLSPTKKQRTTVQGSFRSQVEKT